MRLLDSATGYRRWGLALAAVLVAAASAEAAGGDRTRHSEVLIVVNGASEISTAIGEHYRRQRDVPAANVVRLALPLADPTLASPEHESVDRRTFVEQIRNPIERYLRSRGLVEKIEIIVTTKGVPLRVRGEVGRIGASPLRDERGASVDAELALLFSGRDGAPGVTTTINPYFDSDEPFAAFRSRHPKSPLHYLTARLTGYQDPPEAAGRGGVPRDVLRLMAAARARSSGRIFLVDEDPAQAPVRAPGNRLLLAPAAAALRSLGLTVFHDRSEAFRFDVHDLVGYASWGSNDDHDPGPPFYGEIGGRRYPGSFAGRAIAADIVSSNARSFVHPAQYGQSLVADLIRMGVAGAAGHVAEPLLGAVARPHILFRRYAQGVPAAEAYFRSIPYLGWMNVYVGDPLMRMGREAPQAGDDLDADGIPDARDNCSEIPNGDQRDSNADGYGNVCDADVDGDGSVTTSWGEAPYGDVEVIRASALARTYDPDHDLDGDGAVDESDVSWAHMLLFLAPGPSGVAP